MPLTADDPDDVDLMVRIRSMLSDNSFSLDKVGLDNAFLRKLKSLKLKKKDADKTSLVHQNYKSYKDSNNQSVDALLAWMDRVVEELPDTRGMSLRDLDNAMGGCSRSRLSEFLFFQILEKLKNF